MGKHQSNIVQKEKLSSLKCDLIRSGISLKKAADTTGYTYNRFVRILSGYLQVPDSFEKQVMSLFKKQPLTEAERLLQDALSALNAVPNTRIDFGEYRNTYELCSKIDEYFRNREEPHSDNDVCQNCDGSGKLRNNTYKDKKYTFGKIACHHCNGTGFTSKKEGA